ncbi:MAG: hypothetical protein IPJ88_17115 [Myxococcales bacterium]|nr:MAG: hypothetical protein IPJ88_17115 [Myxococcales bacterium]
MDSKAEGSPLIQRGPNGLWSEGGGTSLLAFESLLSPQVAEQRYAKAMGAMAG